MSVLGEAREFGAYSARALVATAGVWRFTSEVLRQLGLLVAGTTLLVTFLTFVLGAECALFGLYFLRPVGATDFVGLITAFCSDQFGIALMFGYAFAAKVGCGLVAEIGSMRIKEELDAFESVGVDPMRFVVGTRIAAAFLFMPFAFLVCAAAFNLGGFLYVTAASGEVSQGGFEAQHWPLQSFGAYLDSSLKFFAIGTAIVLVATYYGFRVRGGPVDVGTATSRSMVANLVLVHVIDGVLNIVLFPKPAVPIGG